MHTLPLRSRMLKCDPPVATVPSHTLTPPIAAATAVDDACMASTQLQNRFTERSVSPWVLGAYLVCTSVCWSQVRPAHAGW